MGIFSWFCSHSWNETIDFANGSREIICIHCGKREYDPDYLSRKRSDGLRECSIGRHSWRVNPLYHKHEYGSGKPIPYYKKCDYCGVTSSWCQGV